MERLKSSVSCIAAESRFARWVALSALSISCQYIGTLATYVAVFDRSLWRLMLLSIEMVFETAICFVRFLWLPKFHRGISGKSGIPSPAFDIVVVTAVILFATLANTNLL